MQFVCTQISTVVFLFRYQLRTALSVGLGMAQIGEFAFVLLSSASQHNLIPYQLYMLLMGVHLYRMNPFCHSSSHATSTT